MSRSQAMRVHELRETFRLVGEIRELGHEPLIWRQHMLVGLAKLLGCQVCGAAENAWPASLYASIQRGVVAIGYRDHREMLKHVELASSGRFLVKDPARAAADRIADSPNVTVRREQLVDDSVWYRSEYSAEMCRPFDIDSYLFSSYAIPKLKVAHVLTLSRPWNDKPFEQRHTRLLALFHNELGRLWKRALRDDPMLQAVPARERQVLFFLVDGASEKEAAAELGISSHTLHDYVKRLHARFDVASRGELVAKVRRRRLFSAPRLVMAGGERLADVV